MEQAADSTASNSRRRYPPEPRALPTSTVSYGQYRARFAANRDELDAVQRLRYSVFNLELGEGLETSRATGRDEDDFDLSCHHLLVENLETGAVVGTYRLQTLAMAEAGSGLYSAGEFDLSSIPREVMENGVEVGRACIAREHRRRHILFLLWKGLALYVSFNGKRYLFGCSSLNTQDPCEGLRVFDSLAAAGHHHPQLLVSPLPGKECRCDRGADQTREPVELPALFGAYLRYGARVCGPPAIDREFKTIDFWVLLDVQALDSRTYRLFFN